MIDAYNGLMGSGKTYDRPLRFRGAYVTYSEVNTDLFRDEWEPSDWREAAGGALDAPELVPAGAHHALRTGRTIEADGYLEEPRA